MFTAIVLTKASVESLRRVAENINLIKDGWKTHLHHCTLNMGDTGNSKRAFVNDIRLLKVTHFGFKDGRVTAFKVEGASDSVNKVPHITIATNGNAKPVESNDITLWIPMQSIIVSGVVKVCK